MRKKFKFSCLNACNSLLLRIVVNILLLLMLNITIVLLQHLCQAWSLNLTSLDDNNHEEKEEWILMAELSIQDKKDFEQLIIPPCSYWQEAKKHFSSEEIGTIPTWVTTMKHHYNPQWNMFTWLTHHNLKQPTTGSL